jgi:hypothetical protein
LYLSRDPTSSSRATATNVTDILFFLSRLCFVFRAKIEFLKRACLHYVWSSWFFLEEKLYNNGRRRLCGQSGWIPIHRDWLPVNVNGAKPTRTGSRASRAFVYTSQSRNRFGSASFANGVVSYSFYIHTSSYFIIFCPIVSPFVRPFFVYFAPRTTVPKGKTRLGSRKTLNRQPTIQKRWSQTNWKRQLNTKSEGIQIHTLTKSREERDTGLFVFSVTTEKEISKNENDHSLSLNSADNGSTFLKNKGEKETNKKMKI